VIAVAGQKFSKEHFLYLGNSRSWISVDATDLFNFETLVVQLSTELFGFQPNLI